MEICESGDAKVLQLAHRIQHGWQRGGPQVEKLLEAALRKSGGCGSTRILDALQLGWPWLRARLSEGFIAGRKGMPKKPWDTIAEPCNHDPELAVRPRGE